MNVLIIEEEPLIASFLKRGLKARGYCVEIAETGKNGLSRLRELPTDIVLLDLRLPDMDGTDVLRALREEGNDVPVLVLTARTSVEDRVQALELGADDYVTKPFVLDELLARMGTLVRRRNGHVTNVLHAGSIALDLRRRQATVGARTVDLSAREFALLEALLRHPGHVLSREQLLSQVWGLQFDPRTNVVEVYVSYLRRKLGEAAIETVRGMGYRVRV